MSAPAVASTTLLRVQRFPTAATLPNAPVFACAMRVLFEDRVTKAITSRDVRAVLSTGDVLSVVFRVNSNRLRACAGAVGHDYPLSWLGVPCELVRLWIGLPVLGSTTPRPFRLLALLPTRDVEDVPPCIRLGTEFLQANRASVELTSSPWQGQLVIPYT
jgi:hypothetical protein